MSFRRYPKYKDSGVEWLGEVPEHWEVSRFKQHLERNDGGVWGDEPVGIGDTVVLRSTEQTIDGRWQIDDPASRQLSEAEINAALLSQGDLLLTKSSGSSLHIGKTTLVDANVAAMKCCYSNFMQRLRLRSSCEPKFVWYLLNNPISRLQFDLLSNSTTGLANLNGTVIGQLIMPTAPLSEQHSIAAFLDRETAKIDALIAEQQRLIELLQEKRQAVISHAVTKGLNPDAPMKDSGIEWLGEVPAHWEVLSLKYLAILKSGDSITSDTIEETGDFPVFGGNGLRGFTDRYTHDGDYVVIGRQGALCGNVHYASGRFWASEHAVVATPRVEFEVRWFGELIRAMNLNQYSVTAAQPGLSMEFVGNLRTVLPPPNEQREIASYLLNWTMRIDELDTEARKAISLLQERRSALISAAVTGQIDLRGLAPKEAA
jgi:type I restriction enzyme S subunit